MKVLQFPLTRITICFVIGILVGKYFILNTLFVFVFLLIAFVVFAISYRVLVISVKQAFLFSLLAYFLAFGIGVTTHVIHTTTFQKSNYIHSPKLFEKPHLVSLTIREKLKYSEFNDRYIAIVNQMDLVPTTGKLLLNIRKESVTLPYEVGSHVKVYAFLYKHSRPKNPNQFDYGSYLENLQIYSQIYANVSEIKNVAFITKDLWYYTSKLRSTILRNLEKNNFNKTELDVAIALLLGQKQAISPEVIRDYQFAGAVHILAVSGLHIGIILLFLNILLKPLSNTRRGSFVKLVIVLTTLSSFAIIAGLSPSILRSVTMFSFVAIGMYLRRSTSIYHTLLVSALLILLFKPSFLFEVGFQLSYLALFFILWVQPLVSQLWKPSNRIIKYFWDILTVSFAAQIGVLPLSIYYFHQFPGLFFITNLVVIPFLSFLMPLGVVVVVLAAFDIVPLFLSKLLEWGILVMNKFIAFIASFEQFVLLDIPFNWQFLCSVYFLVIAIFIWMQKPSFNRLILALFGVLVFQFSYFANFWTINCQSELVVFNSKNYSLITERHGEEVTVFAKDSLLNSTLNNKFLSAYLMGNFSHLKSKQRLENLIFFKGRKILILDSLRVYPTNVSPDIVILTQSPKINLDRFLLISKPKIVVADATNFTTLQKSWKWTCFKHKIPFHATSEKGFYRLN